MISIVRFEAQIQRGEKVMSNSIDQQSIPSNQAKRGLGWVPFLLLANTALILFLGFQQYSQRTEISDHIAKLEGANQEMKQAQAQSVKKADDLSSDLEVLNKRVGVTANELNQARQVAQALKREQEQAAKVLAAKANSTDVETYKQEAAAQMSQIKDDANAKLGTVSGEVTGVKNDLVAAKEDFGRQLIDVKNVLGADIARNSGELSELRKKGERDYFEFDIRKDSKHPMQRVGDLQLALTKTDPKNHKYSVAIQVDDNRLDKKDRTTNEPVQFLVGRDRLRYELVVNSVDKDRIRGYLSVPKDKVLAAEVPTFRQ
jgi:cell division protein FtsB